MMRERNFYRPSVGYFVLFFALASLPGGCAVKDGLDGAGGKKGPSPNHSPDGSDLPDAANDANGGCVCSAESTCCDGCQPRAVGAFCQDADHPILGTTCQPDGSCAGVSQATLVLGAGIGTYDILWVIDNSGSMCQEQEALRSNFEHLIDPLIARGIDFQMGVTTTHMDANSSDQLARAGHLQAMPQPVPSVLEGCAGQENQDGKNTDSDPLNGYRPIRVNIDQAIACTRNPEQWQHLRQITDNEIACIYNLPDAQNCPQDMPARHQIFPTTPSGGRVGYATPPADNPYRPIRGGGKVLRSADYRNANGKLDVEALRADFACMSLVGTQGSGFEKGLAAAIRATSPAMTGGTVEAPQGAGAKAPNHGLLRQDANFGLIFVTDENDCSDYALFAGDSDMIFEDEQGNQLTGGVDVRTACQDTVCAIYNIPGFQNSPLITPEHVAQRLLDNLSASKGQQVHREQVSIASFHGDYRRYGEQYPSAAAIENAISAQPASEQVAMREKIREILRNPNACDEDIRREPFAQIAEKVSCGTPELGDAFSGDRYERFLRQFSAGRVFPAIPAHESDHMPGLICSEDGLGEMMRRAGRLLADPSELCFSGVPLECANEGECPGFAFGSASPVCQPFGRTGRNFCDSGLQLHMYPGAGIAGRSFADLQAHPYCIPESIDSPFTPGGCVINPERYDVVTCSTRDDAMQINWRGTLDQLVGFEVQLAYSVREGTDD